MESGYAFILFIDPWDDTDTASLELLSKDGRTLVPTGVLDEEALAGTMGTLYLERTDWNDAYELMISIEGSDSIYVTMEEIEIALETEGFVEAYTG